MFASFSLGCRSGLVFLGDGSACASVKCSKKISLDPEMPLYIEGMLAGDKTRSQAEHLALLNWDPKKQIHLLTPM